MTGVNETSIRRGLQPIHYCPLHYFGGRIWCFDLAGGSENDISRVRDRGAPKNQGQRGEDNAAMPAEIKQCDVRGVGTEVEVESGLPDRALLAPSYCPPNRGLVFSANRHSNPYPTSRSPPHVWAALNDRYGYVVLKGCV